MARRWVLLIHEDPGALTELENALQGTGLHVTMARNAVLGASQAKDLRPALIISDQEFSADAPFMLVGKAIDKDSVKARAVELTTARPAAEAAPAAEEPAPASAARRTGRRWVLFIHEDAKMVSDVEQALHGTGMHLTTAADVALAAVQARDMQPVLIVSDIATPATLNDIRREPAASRTPFIYITIPDESHARSLMPRGDASVRCLAKPFDPEHLKTLALALTVSAS
jgi:DNA-binding response OmpR family regulator